MNLRFQSSIFKNSGSAGPGRCRAFAALILTAAFFFLLTVLIPAPSASAGEVTFKAPSAPVKASPDGKTEAVIGISIVPPYHIYAPGDKTGIPLSFSLPANIGEIVSASLPAPLKKSYPAMGDELLLFEGSFEARLTMVLRPDIAGKVTRVPVSVKYQACTDLMCTPPASETVEITIDPAGTKPAPSNAQGAGSGAIENNLVITAQGHNAVPAPTGDGKTASKGTDAASPASAAGSPATVNAGSNAAQSGAGSRNAFMKFYEEGFFWALLIAFFWGLVSSLTPCVYPMIPITVAFFSNQGGNSRSKTFALALVFVTGIALSFAALGVVVTLIGVDMGSIMSNPWIVAFVCALLLFFAGAMFELYEIRMPDSLMSKVGQSEQGFFGAFTMGLTMGLVAAPCVGPFAGSLLIFVSAIKSIPIGFAMLFSYGLGLGMLFLVFAMGASFMPRSGMWMVRVKYFFGLVLLWITLYFMQFVTPREYMLLAACFFSAVTAAILGAFSNIDENAPLQNHVAKAMGYIFIIAGAAFLIAALSEAGFLAGAGGRSMPHAVSNNASTGAEAAKGENPVSAEAGWSNDHDGSLAAAKAAGKPVIVDFYADWCIPCKQMEADIFKNPAFIEATKDFVKVKLDCTRPDGPGTKIKKERYNSPFMPYIVFYDGKGNLLPNEIQGYTKLEDMLAIVRNIK